MTGQEAALIMANPKGVIALIIALALGAYFHHSAREEIREKYGDDHPALQYQPGM